MHQRVWCTSKILIISVMNMTACTHETTMVQNFWHTYLLKIYSGEHGVPLAPPPQPPPRLSFLGGEQNSTVSIALVGSCSLGRPS